MKSITLDKVDVNILGQLAQNGRSSIKQLAASAGLSSPSTSERLRRLEENGVITGYRADIDARAVGFEVEALVRIRPLPGRVQAVAATIEAIEEVVHCDKVTGEDCFIARVRARNLLQLDAITERIGQEAITVTAIVKGQLFGGRAIPLLHC